MSNARDTETSPLTPEQKQRAEAVACAVAALGQIRQHDDRVAAYEVVQVAEFITGHPHHTIDAESVGNAPEPEDGDASATEKVTECQWPGCQRDATPADEKPRIAMLVRRGLDGEWSSHPACVRHDNRTLYAGAGAG